MFHLPRNPHLVLLAAMTALILFLGLRPFDYRVRNDAGWIGNGRGFRFAGHGMAVAGCGASLSGFEHSDDGITLELVLKPASLPDTHLPHILSFSDSEGKERFYLGQWKDFIILREIDYSGVLTRTFDRIGARGVLIPSRETVVTLVSDKAGTTLYVNGKPIRNQPILNLYKMIHKASVGFILLGNAPTGVEGWEGEINGFSLLDRPLTPGEAEERPALWKQGKGTTLLADGANILFIFDEGSGMSVKNLGKDTGWRLRIPATLSPLKRDVLALPPLEALKRQSFYEDAGINLLGFIPFGFFLSFYLFDRRKLNRKSLFLAVFFTATALSLFIELNQAFLLSRDSSITDLALNIGGGAMGSWFSSFHTHPGTPPEPFTSPFF